jgi:hypothetical protein
VYLQSCIVRTPSKAHPRRLPMSLTGSGRSLAQASISVGRIFTRTIGPTLTVINYRASCVEAVQRTHKRRTSEGRLMSSEVELVGSAEGTSSMMEGMDKISGDE